eukprot:UN32358
MYRHQAWQMKKMSGKKSAALKQVEYESFYAPDAGECSPGLTKLAKQYKTSIQRLAYYFAECKFRFVSATNKHLEIPEPPNVLKRTYSRTTKKNKSSPKSKRRKTNQPSLTTFSKPLNNKQKTPKKKKKRKIKWNDEEDEMLRDLFYDFKGNPDGVDWSKFYESAERTFREKGIPRTIKQIKGRFQKRFPDIVRENSINVTAAKEAQLYSQLCKHFEEQPHMIPIFDRIKNGFMYTFDRT